MATQINRDPFARETLVRQTEDSGHCAECGQTRPNGRIFRYGVERDAIYTRVNWDREVFCSIGCRRIYHGA